MPSLTDIIAQGRRVEAHRPWPRVIVTADGWRTAANELAAGRATLLGLWGEAGAQRAVHMAMIDRGLKKTSPSSALNARDKTFPSVGALHPPAIRLERAIHSLFGLEPVGAPDARPWLDLGFWDVQYPLGPCLPAAELPAAYDFLPVEGESLHRIPVGPVHAGIIEPGHFRFTASGETVVRLEQRLGYVHKGIESLMAGATIETAAQTCRAHVRRQHGRLWHRLRACGGGGIECRSAGAGAIFACADGGARTTRQPFRRHRRHLQRCLVRAHARALRHPARSWCCARPKPVLGIA